MGTDAVWLLTFFKIFSIILVNQIVSVPIDFHCIVWLYNRIQNWLPTLEHEGE